MKNKLFLGISLVSFCAFSPFAHLFAYSEDLPQQLKPQIAIAENAALKMLKTFKTIKKTVKTEIIKELLKKLILLNLEHSKHKKHFDRAGAKDSPGVSFAKDKSSVRLLEIAPPRNFYSNSEKIWSTPSFGSVSSGPSTKAYSIDETTPFETSPHAANTHSDTRANEQNHSIQAIFKAEPLQTHDIQHESLKDLQPIIDLDNLRIYRDPQGKFFSINDKILLTKKGLVRLNNRIARQEKSIQYLKNRLQALTIEFASNCISEDELLTTQIELHKAIELYESLKEAQRIHKQELEAHKDILSLLDQLPSETQNKSKLKNNPSGAAQTFFQSFNTSEQNILAEKSDLWKGQKAIQDSLAYHFDVDISIDSPAIIAIYKLHKEILRDNPRQSIENTTYYAGRSILSEVMDSLGEDVETKKTLTSLFPSPKRYPSAKHLIDDYSRRLSNLPALSGGMTIDLIKRHFDQVVNLRSKQAETAYNFWIKLLDLSLRLNKGVHGARAIASMNFVQEEFLKDVARTLTPLKNLFGVRSTLDVLKDTFQATQIEIEPYDNIVKKVQELIVEHLVGANKHDTVENLKQLYISLTGNLSTMGDLLEKRFQDLADDPVVLKAELSAFIDDTSGKHAYLDPLQNILQDTHDLVHQRLDPLQGRQLAGSKLIKIIQETHLAAYNSLTSKSVDPDDVVGRAMNELIKQEFKRIAMKNQALAIPVEALTKDLFLDGLFEGISMSAQDREEISNHIKKVVTLFKLADSMGRQEYEKRENELLSPTFKKLSHKVALLLSKDAYVPSTINIQRELASPSKQGHSPRELKQNIQEIIEDLAPYLDQAILDLKTPLETLSKGQVRNVLTQCIKTSPKTKNLSEQTHSDILDLLTQRIKRIETALSKSDDIKKELTKTHINLASNYKATLGLLGADTLTRKQTLAVLSEKQKLWLYNALVDLGEEALIMTPAIENRLNRIIDQESRHEAKIAYTHADFLEDVISKKDSLSNDASSDFHKEDLSVFEITLSSSLAWQKHDDLIRQKGLKSTLKEKTEEQEKEQLSDAMQSLTPLFTATIKGELGLNMGDGKMEIKAAMETALRNQDIMNVQFIAHKRNELEQSKQMVLGNTDQLKDAILQEPITDPKTAGKKDFASHLDRFLRKISKHLGFFDDTTIKGFMLILSERFNIRTPSDLTNKKVDLKKSVEIISKELLEKFHDLFHATNERDATSVIKSHIIAFEDALDGDQKSAMTSYAYSFYCKAKNHYFNDLSSGFPIEWRSFLDKIEDSYFKNKLSPYLKLKHNLTMPEFEQEMTIRLQYSQYSEQDIKKIILQAKRVVIAQEIVHSENQSLEQILTLAINQSIDAPNRKPLRIKQKNQSIQQIDFDDVIRKSSPTLERLLMSKILGLDESIAAKGQYAECFSSLELVSSSMLLNGLLGLIDELDIDGFEKESDSIEARHQAKRALIKRFAKFEVHMLDDASLNQILNKKAIPLKQNFKITLASELHHNDREAQLRVLATMNHHQLKDLYNSLVFEPNDMIPYVDNQLITHRLMRIVSAAHANNDRTSIDYTFHDHMDTIMHNIDADTFDIDLSERSSTHRKESLLDLDRLVIGKLAWEKNISAHDSRSVLGEKSTEEFANEIKNKLIKKGVKDDITDF